MSQLFISYASADRDKVQVFAEALQAEGWSVWWDRDIDLGRPFHEAIEEKMLAADCVLVLWSPTSRKSRYVREEANEALAMRKLVPVLFGAVRQPFGFRDLPSVDLVDWQGDTSDSRFQRLCAGIASRVKPAMKGAKRQGERAEKIDNRVTAADSGGQREFAVPLVERAATAHQAVLPEPVDVFRDPLEGDFRGPEMVVPPAGQFWMGSDPETDPDAQGDEQPRHLVRIGEGLAMGRFPITFQEYDDFATATGRKLSDDEGWGRKKRPVFSVSWVDASAYAAWLSQQTGRGYRLPTEAEWEYAARAGTTTPCYWSDKTGEASDYVWFSDDADGRTQTVGQRQSNDFGLYDNTSGNVWEWVEDDWHDSYQGAPGDGSAWLDAGSGARVLRGGSWLDRPRLLRSAYRENYFPGYRCCDVGFRVVCRPHRL